MFNLTRRKRIRPRSGASVQLRTQFGSASSLHSHILPQTRRHHPTVISNEAGRRFFFHVCSCKRVGLRSEKSFFAFFAATRRVLGNSGTKFRDKRNVSHS